MSIKTKETILGLDVGTASLGWSLIEYDYAKRDGTIIATGSRVFPEGLDRTKGEKSRNEDRRAARQIRRQLERKHRRREKVKHILQNHGLLPTDDDLTQQEFWAPFDPYAIRAKALKTKLTPYELGRAFYHLNQRRGYQSNRKTGNEKDGAVAAGIGEIAEHIRTGNHSTLGEYLATIKVTTENFDQNCRRRGKYTARSMYLEEFKLIWRYQAQFYPDLLNEALRTKLHTAIFYQRPLKSQRHLVGNCQFIPDRKRAAKATLIAQRIRIWGDINRMRILLPQGDEKCLSARQSEALFSALNENEKQTWSQVRKLLQRHDPDLSAETYASVKFNLEAVNDKQLKGNKTTAVIKKHLGKTWEQLNSRQQEDFVLDLLHIEEDKVLKRRLRKHWELSADDVEIAMGIKLEDGYTQLSSAAMRKLLPFMSGAHDEAPYLEYDKACKAAGWHHSQKKQGNASRLEPVRDSLRNPLVHRSMSEMRHVVNRLIDQHGLPDIIRVELARDLKNSPKQRADIQKKQNRLKKLNEEAADFLQQEHGMDNPKYADIIKYRLWKECGKVCPYTGKTINADELFGHTPQFQVEHILPYSRSRDNSFFNKTLCCIEENARKGNQTPYECYNKNKELYAAVLARVERHLPHKAKRFRQTELDEDFTARQLNDTRYIAKETKAYLEQLSCKVQSVKGGTTSDLRWHWGVDRLVGDPDSDQKDRSDHRHHALDAIVIALTSPKLLNEFSRRSSMPDLNGQVKHRDVQPPWKIFRDDVEKAMNAITVSHRMDHKAQGPLHEETLYSHTGKTNDKGDGLIAIRRNLETIKPSELKLIRDEHVRDLALAHHAQYKRFDDDHPLLLKHGDTHRRIRRVRIIKPLQVESIGSGERLRHVKTGNNHHVEIVSYEKNGKTRYEAIPVSLLECMRRKQRGLPIIRQQHDGKNFVMALHKGDAVTFGDHSPPQDIWIMTSIEGPKQLQFRRDTDARPGADRSAAIRKSPQVLMNMGMKQIYINVLGEIDEYENRHH